MQRTCFTALRNLRSIGGVAGSQKQGVQLEILDVCVLGESPAAEVYAAWEEGTGSQS